MKKLQKTAKGLDTFFKIFYWISIAVIVICCVAIAIMWLLYLGDPNILDLFHTDLDFGMIQFSLADSVEPANNRKLLYLALSSVIGIAQAVIFCMEFHTIRRILAPLKEGRPFHDDIVRCLKRLGWLTVTDGILANLGSLITSGNLLFSYDLSELFLSDKITHVTVNHSLNLDFVIYAVLFFLLSYVFEYGEQLQQLSDETL